MTKENLLLLAQPSPLKSQPPQFPALLCLTHNLKIQYFCTHPSCVSSHKSALCPTCYLIHPAHAIISRDSLFSQKIFDELLTLREIYHDNNKRNFDNLLTEIDKVFIQLEKNLLSMIKTAHQKVIEMVQTSRKNAVDNDPWDKLWTDLQSFFDLGTKSSSLDPNACFRSLKRAHLKYSILVEESRNLNYSDIIQSIEETANKFSRRFTKEIEVISSLHVISLGKNLLNFQENPKTRYVHENKNDLKSLKILRRLRLLTKEKNITNLILLDTKHSKYATSSSDGKIVIRDTTRNIPIRRLQGSPVSVHTLMELSDGRLACGNEMGEIQCWNLNTGVCENILKSSRGGCVKALMELPNRILVSGHEDEVIAFWSLRMNENACLRKIENSSQSICWCICVLNDSEIACGSDCEINVYEVCGANFPVRKMRGHRGRVRMLVVLERSEGIKLASVGEDKVVKIWDYDEAVCLRSIGTKLNLWQVLSVSPEVVGLFYKDGRVECWGVKTGKCKRYVL